jgi:hypothetical protein
MAFGGTIICMFDELAKGNYVLASICAACVALNTAIEFIPQRYKA